MTQQNVPELLEKFDEELPHFPDGRIDYSDSDTAPIVKILVRCGGEILILKRSDRVLTYRGRWNTVAGYLDEPKPVREKALEELGEETGISQEDILRIKVGEHYEFFDNETGKMWLVHPVLVELKRKPEITLDWEHTEHRWIRPEELDAYDAAPTMDKRLFTF